MNIRGSMPMQWFLAVDQHRNVIRVAFPCVAHLEFIKGGGSTAARGQARQPAREATTLQQFSEALPATDV